MLLVQFCQVQTREKLTRLGQGDIFLDTITKRSFLFDEDN